MIYNICTSSVSTWTADMVEKKIWLNKSILVTLVLLWSPSQASVNVVEKTCRSNKIMSQHANRILMFGINTTSARYEQITHNCEKKMTRICHQVNMLETENRAWQFIDFCFVCRWVMGDELTHYLCSMVVMTLFTLDFEISFNWTTVWRWLWEIWKSMSSKISHSPYFAEHVLKLCNC